MTDSNSLAKFVMQGLSMANNYFFTGRPNKALEMIGLIKKIDPENDTLKIMMHKVFCVANNQPTPDLDYEFGTNWKGESLENKSIEIFCDQGMGDTINLLRYVHQLKKKYNCKIILNCYAFFNQFERLISKQDYIDEFTPFHINCDYSTNIMSIPSIINKLDLEIYYPVYFEENMKFEIPEQPFLGRFDGIKLDGKNKIGFVWQSNSENILSLEKSIPVELLQELIFDSCKSFCLQPNIECPDWMEKLPIDDLYDTAAFIQQCDCVVSVDTVVLHLAGMMGKKTFGLIPFDCDPRWGKSNETIWYPSVELFRQKENKNWSEVISLVKNRLTSFFSK
jgi:hypothetical protein